LSVDVVYPYAFVLCPSRQEIGLELGNGPAVLSDNDELAICADRRGQCVVGFEQATDVLARLKASYKQKIPGTQREALHRRAHELGRRCVEPIFVHAEGDDADSRLGQLVMFDQFFDRSMRDGNYQICRPRAPAQQPVLGPA
jgi:hypothetical protein